MSLLVLVRHGQAPLQEGADRGLTELGRRQARGLGEAWARSRRRLTHVVVGPRARHRDTATELAAAYAASGLPWPTPETLPALDEYPGEAILERALPELSAHPQLAAAVAQLAGPERHRAFGKIMVHVMSAWARGELAGPETFGAFRDRVRGALDELAARCGRGAEVAAFTSAGTIAVAAGRALGTDDVTTLSLSFVHWNAAVTELLFSERWSLRSFNAPAIAPDLVTIQ